MLCLCVSLVCHIKYGSVLTQQVDFVVLLSESRIDCSHMWRSKHDGYVREPANGLQTMFVFAVLSVAMLSVDMPMYLT